MTIGTKALIGAAGNLAESQAHAAIDGEELTPTQMAADVALGGLAATAEPVATSLVRSEATAGKLQNEVRRATNIAAEGRPRPAQAQRAAEAVARVGAYERAAEQKGSAVVEILKKALEPDGKDRKGRHH